ncbi:two-component regulator propeller domain-containing protein [Tenacibaculum sp. UWU-22]|uniref:two-component regulator propeller domain-containing protein n=1 Tax=Tenacibaculum sp. UWU-22 TaxID=3234187 RepID=UPI0034DB31BB
MNKQTKNIKLTIIGAVIVFLSTITSAQNHINFSHISPKLNGKDIIVTQSIQNPVNNNIWMVCSTGILIYNGYDYKHIANDVIFKDKKRNDAVKNILVDTSNNIWILSNFGFLIKYNSNNNHFKDISHIVKNDAINTLKRKNNNIWLASKKGTIYRYANNKLDSITHIPTEKSAKQNIIDIEVGSFNELYLSTGDGAIFVYSDLSKKAETLKGPFTNYPGNVFLMMDNQYRLWIGTETQGLLVYNTLTKSFINNKVFEKSVPNMKNEMVISLFCDSSGNIWAGTDGGGLYKVAPRTEKVSLYRKENSNPFSLATNTIINISEDAYKNLWVINNYGKVNILPSANNNINYFEGSANNTPTRVLSIYKSSKNILWVGTDGSGLTKVKFNPDGTTKETQYFNDVNKGFYVQSITEDKNGNIWFGTYKNGLWAYKAKTKTFEKLNVINTKNQKASDVRTLFCDSKGRIWVGSDVSINLYSSNFKLLASFDNNSHGLKGSNTRSILEDYNGIVWLGLYQGGMFGFNENKNNLKTSTFTSYWYSDEKTQPIRDVKSMALTKANMIWLINISGELLQFNPTTKKYTTFNNLTALNDRNFRAVAVQDDDNIWLSSNNGIYHFQVKKAVLKNYNAIDGLQGDVFLRRSVFKDKEGLLYFGGLKGLNFFNPEKMSKKESKATLQIDKIEVLNQPANILIPDQIKSGASNVTALKLKNNQDSFSFQFFAIDNVLDPKYYYTYRLKGFDTNWIPSHSNRVATYTNIPSGHYTFEVKAGTKKGVWNIPVKKISIKIEPPFWKSTLAYILYLCLLVLIIYGIKRWYDLKKNLFLEKINHKKDSELNELKMNFFAKISHEIQTPITLILGPVEEMLKQPETNKNLLLKQRLNIVAYNTKRLSKIASELTLVRDKELDKLQLNVTKNNLHQNITAIANSFNELARKKNIDFSLNYAKNNLETWYDKEKVEHVLYNLLSNAFKFTPKEGRIELSVLPTNSNKMMKFLISDSGQGIDQNELNLIFELFYQSKKGRNAKGTGIGLALTKELITLHKGVIDVESTLNKGTAFTIKIPISKEAYNDSERIITDEPEQIEKNITIEKPVKIKKDNNKALKKAILIVEDNYELQNFLNDLLKDQYHVSIAENGKEGYEYAKNNVPDLILSDIMMPEMDGVEMSKKLQNNPITKHIPIILLTAKNSTRSKIEGLESGAVEYIKKPFNIDELLLKVKNIITAKEHIISKYRKEFISRPEVKIEKSPDEIFLENLVDKINLKIDDANFKMDELCHMLNMSYSNVYRKCLALTGHSLLDFVRLIRLKKAAVLITKFNYSVSESAFMTGFNDPKYFSKCFKKAFKKSPIKFKKEVEKIGLDDYLKKYKMSSFFSD